MRRCVGLVFAMVLLMAASASARPVWQVDVEGGAAFIGYNRIRVPGDGGTKFSVTEELDADPSAFWRARLNWHVGERHTFSLLVAPLRLEAAGQFDTVIEFEGVTFEPDIPVVVKYRFDSYRLTYRYGLIWGETFRLGLGVTAKIRDAAIEVESSLVQEEEVNTGFVPLVNFALDWRPSARLTIRLAGDALAAPQGRAEDVLAALLYEVFPGVQVKGGYRLLEGGVDNDEVYNFALVHYAVAGIIVSL